MSLKQGDNPVVIVGAGPAGLTAAYALAQRDRAVVVLEQSAEIGGLARTVVYNGFRFDIGGHRFFTKVDLIQQLWQEVLGEAFKVRPRRSRIYYRGRFFNYPLRLGDVIRQLGPLDSGLALLSYVRTRLFPLQPEDSFETWVINRFGRRLYQHFFKSYTEKVWGIPCSQIRAEWAAQRIRGLSFRSALTDALGRPMGGAPTSLITEFYYPDLGPGQMWEAFAAQIEARGGQVRRQAEVEQITLQNDGVVVHIRTLAGPTEIAATHVISSMPLAQLVQRLRPAPPPEVLQAAGRLAYRDFLIVNLIIDRADLFPDNWLYIHSPDFRVGRIQNFKNWSSALTPDASLTSVGLEYFCSHGDDLWQMEDAALLELAADELERLGLAQRAWVIDGMVIRQLRAYPVYDQSYQAQVAAIRRYLAALPRLQTVGRNGLHRYNNQDHSMLTGWLAAHNILGESHDVWEVNTDRSYYEELVLASLNGAMP